MRRELTAGFLAIAVVLAAGCAAPPKRKDYTKFLAAKPRSILVVPVVNNSVDLNAADYFLSAISIPLAERGYYVFPVNMVKRVLEDDGLADASLVHRADPRRLAALFGADCVLYVTVDAWEAKYVIIDTKVKVAFSYSLKDGKTGEELWTEKRAARYSASAGSQGLIEAAVKAAIAKAKPRYLPLTRQANFDAMVYPGPGFPAGPYRPEYQKDLEP